MIEESRRVANTDQPVNYFFVAPPVSFFLTSLRACDSRARAFLLTVRLAAWAFTLSSVFLFCDRSLDILWGMMHDALTMQRRIAEAATMTKTMRDYGVPGNEEEREVQQRIAEVTDAFWRARFQLEMHGERSPQYREAQAAYLELAHAMRSER